MDPVRLQKVDEKTFHDTLESFAIRYAYILFPLCIVAALILFGLLIFTVCGICAVESGALRNFIANGV